MMRYVASFIHNLRPEWANHVKLTWMSQAQHQWCAGLVMFLLAGLASAESVSLDMQVSTVGKRAHFEYILTPSVIVGEPENEITGSEGYRAAVWVFDAEGRELWGHEWEMAAADLQEMMQEEGRASINEWVNLFFTSKPLGMTTFARRKLQESEFVPEFFADAAKELNVKPELLKAAIFSESTNFIFVYRSAWREQLNALVYVPKYNRFISYAGYGY